MTSKIYLEKDRVDEDGNFLCPKCKRIISADDFDEKNYSIIETRYDNNTLIILISCKCGEKIELICGGE